MRTDRAPSETADAREREVAALLVLLATPGLSGPATCRLLARHGSGTAALRAIPRECAEEVARAARSEQVRERVRRALSVVHAHGITLVSCAAAEYPALLRDRLGDHAPPVLFALGRLDLLHTVGVGVVGCRRPTEYGLDVAEQLAGAIARAGGCVVSGLARGIDAAAHVGALDAGGTTIGVLGCGIDVSYPRENARLQARIRDEGLLLSELLPGEPPRRHQFPHRNRIIAALSRVVAVVEAGQKSGAVTTANHAAELGVPVYGVVNAMDQPNVQGILRLLRDGAHPLTSFQDFLEANGLLSLGAPEPAEGKQVPPPVDALHARVWRAMDAEPRHIDQVAAAAQLDPTPVLVALLELELDGRVRQLPGRRFARVQRRALS